METCLSSVPASCVIPGRKGTSPSLRFPICELGWQQVPLPDYMCRGGLLTQECLRPSGTPISPPPYSHPACQRQGLSWQPDRPWEACLLEARLVWQLPGDQSQGSTPSSSHGTVTQPLDLCSDEPRGAASALLSPFCPSKTPLFPHCAHTALNPTRQPAGPLPVYKFPGPPVIPG